MDNQFKKKKILIFLQGVIDGANRITITIGKILSNVFEVKFVILGDDKSILDFIPQELDVSFSSYKSKSIFSLFKMMKIIKRENPYLIYGSQTVVNRLAIVASKFLGKKIIIRSTGMMNYYAWTTRITMKMVYRYADRIIVQQEEMKEEMHNQCGIPHSKIVVLHNILDYDYIDKCKIAESPFADNDVVNYVSVGRICYNKANDVAIKAFAMVKNSIPNAHLYFVGPYEKDTDFFNNVKNIIKEHSLDDCVHFVGYDSNPYKWIVNCHCFIFPSRHEGLPNALLEALYLGVPCVAARCLDIIPKIIQDDYNGYVVDVENVENLALSMKKALNLKNFEMLYKPSSKEDYIKAFDTI